MRKVLNAALEESEDDHDYLWMHRDTFGRTSEINRLEWRDIDFQARTITLYTRKTRDGSLTPRYIDMTDKLYEILQRRYKTRDRSKSWVFWHRYWNRKSGEFVEGPYGYRYRTQRKYCEKAGVIIFGYHGYRNAGASIMAANNSPIREIQLILVHESRQTTEIYISSLYGVKHTAIPDYERRRK